MTWTRARIDRFYRVPMMACTDAVVHHWTLRQSYPKAQRVSQSQLYSPRCCKIGKQMRHSGGRDLIVRHSGHVNFSDSDLNHNGAGVYMSKNKSRSESTLAQLLSVQQPGNLFVDISVRDIQNVLLPNRSALPPRIKQLMLQTIPAPLRRGPFISLGSKGQWNHMHIHAMTIFTQVKGSKGWVIAPADTFPEGKARMKQSHGFAGRHIAMSNTGMCVANSSQVAYINTSTVEERTAAQNLTKYGHCCVVKEGEGFFMPGYSDITGWWHGTCNLDHWNAGFAHIR